MGKSAREGAFGACFAPRTSERLYSARPGSRIWEASSLTGEVTQTIKFKEAFQVTDSTPLLGAAEVFLKKAEGLSLVFSKLLTFENNLLSWLPEMLVLLDPARAVVSAWHPDISGNVCFPTLVDVVPRVKC